MKRIILLVCVFLTMAMIEKSGANSRDFVTLITAEEAAFPDTIITELEKKVDHVPAIDIPVTARTMLGPVIFINKPTEDKLYKDLIDINVRFEKNPLGEPIDMESLRIIYLKMLGIDITDRIRPFIKENQIDAPGVKFPEGEHKFEIRIRDKEQIESTRIISIHVQ